MRRITNKMLNAIRDIIEHARQAGDDEMEWLNIAIEYNELFGTQVTMGAIKGLSIKLADVVTMMNMFTKVMFDPYNGTVRGENP